MSGTSEITKVEVQASDRTGFGDLIRTYRLKGGFSQQKIAEVCGVTIGYISKVEAERQVPSDNLLDVIPFAVSMSAEDTVRFLSAVETAIFLKMQARGRVGGTTTRARGNRQGRMALIGRQNGAVSSVEALLKAIDDHLSSAAAASLARDLADALGDYRTRSATVAAISAMASVVADKS